MDFEEYLELQSETFAQLYRCLPISPLNADDNGGNRVIMPQSALDRLGYLHIEYPMQFQIQNANTLQASHCGVLEFTADEGFVHIPAMMMEHLGLKESDLVLLQSTSLPRATFVKLRPHTNRFFNVSDKKYLLEHSLSKYVCLTTGETIAVTATAATREGTYYLDVVETRPANAVCTIETDCEVEFELALAHAHPVAELGAAMQVEDDAPARFTGAAMRMDGKPVEEEAKKAMTPSSAAAGARAQKAQDGAPVWPLGACQ
uniref:Uncharacterized protein n=1 Tax=Oryza brachyantha TaxID=4533 RepID=J3KWD5_ORYBR